MEWSNNTFIEWRRVDKLPPPGERVLFSWLNCHGYRHTSIGYYAAEFALLAEEVWDNAAELDSDYFKYKPDDEDQQHPYIPKGWYEEGAEAEYCFPQSGVTHWMPLPRSPNRKE
jgi:hypothetical protein